MSKKVLILSGSPRKGGNSDLLCGEFARGAQENGNEVEIIRVAAKKIAPCSGCYYCRAHNGECAHKDDMVRDRKCLAYQIAHFRGLSAEEVIESMYTPRQDGERVQTSSLSDKTAQIAMNYCDRLNRMNREWYEHLEWRMRCVSDELDFFESALHSLPADLEPVMWDLVVEQLKWEAVEQKYAISHTTVYRMRKRAMTALEAMYKKHDQETAAYMLGAEE